MKKLSIITVATCLIAFAIPTPALAAKGKAAGRTPNPERFLNRFDKDGNGVIDGTERDALRQAFDRAQAITKFDTNHDGKLDDSEIAALKPAAGGKAGKVARNKNKNKNKNL